MLTKFKNLLKSSKDIFSLISKDDLISIKKIYTSEIMLEKNLNNLTPMEFALISGKVHVVKYFIEKNIEMPNEINGVNILKILVESENKKYEMINFVLESVKNLNEMIDEKEFLQICFFKQEIDFKIIEILVNTNTQLIEKNYNLLLIDLMDYRSKRNQNEKLNILKLFSNKELKFKATDMTTRFFGRQNPYLPLVQQSKYDLFVEMFRILKEITETEMYSIKNYLPNLKNKKELQKELLKINLEIKSKVYFPPYFYNYDELKNQIESCNIKTLEELDFLKEIVSHIDLTLEQKEDLIEKFISKGGNLEIIIEIGNNSFNILGYLSCFYNNTEKLLKLLLDKGVKIESGGYSALFASIWFGKEEEIKFFLKNNAFLDYIEKDGNTIFSKLGMRKTNGEYVNFKNCLKISKLIIESIENKEKQLELMQKPFVLKHTKNIITNLFSLFTRNFTTFEEENILEYYLSKGIDINEKVNYPEKIFCIKDEIFNTENTDFLLKFIKDNKNLETRDSTGYPLLMNIFFAQVSDEIIDYLITNEKNINQIYLNQNSEETTLLEDLIYKISKPEPIIKKILENHENINLITSTNYSLFMVACKQMYSLELIELIIKKMNNIDELHKITFDDTYDDGVVTPLYNVVNGINFYDNIVENTTEKERYEYEKNVFELLVNHGANVNFKFNQKLLKRKYVEGVEKEEHSILEQCIYNDTRKKETKYTEFLLQTGKVDITLTTGVFKERIENFLALRVGGNVDDKEIIKMFELIKKYFPKDIDLNTRTTTQGTPILIAAQWAKVDIIKWLIDNGGDPHAIGGHDSTNGIDRALGVWADIEPQKRVDTIKLFLDAGVDIEIRNLEGKTPLMVACEVGALSSVKYLLERGADVNAETPEGLSPIHFATFGAYDYEHTRRNEMNEDNKIRIINILVESGVDLNKIPKEGTTPLQYAVHYSYNKIYNKLITEGVDINIVDNYGMTALTRAISIDNKYVKSDLLSKNNLNLDITNHQGENLLFNLVKRNENKETLEELKIFIDKFELEKTINSINETPLFYSVEGKYNFTKLLIEHDYAVNIEDSKGTTPLMIACGFYVENPEDYNFAIQKEIISLLIENGADINYKNVNGKTVIDIAENLNNKPLEEFLLSLGATPKNKIGFRF